MKLYLESGNHKKVGNFSNIEEASRVFVKDALDKDIGLSCVIYVSEWGFFSDIDALMGKSIPLHMVKKFLEATLIKTGDVVSDIADTIFDPDVKNELKDYADKLKADDQKMNLDATIKEAFKKFE